MMEDEFTVEKIPEEDLVRLDEVLFAKDFLAVDD